MADHQNLFEQFPEITLEQWIEKVEKDLKGRPLEELNSQLEEGITIAPFYHAGGENVPHTALAQHKVANEWEIGTYVLSKGANAANKEALEYLSGGGEALRFDLKAPIGADDLQQVLLGIETDYISSHFEVGTEQAMHFLTILEQLLTERRKDLKAFRGSLCLDPFSSPEAEVLCLDLIKAHGATFDHFRLLELDATEIQGQEQSTDALVQLLEKGARLLEMARAVSVDKELMAKHFKISIGVGTNYFVEIAKLRALQILWANLNKAFGIGLEHFPELEVHFAYEAMSEDVNQNLIQASTQAMAAVIGGADRLYVPPAGEGEKLGFYSELARNVQHILKMESFLDRVVDPAAGSYYIETLTRQIAEKAWKKFQDL